MHASYYHKAHACIMVRDLLGGGRRLWASLACGVRGKGPSNPEGAPEVSHDPPWW